MYILQSLCQPLQCVLIHSPFAALVPTNIQPGTVVFGRVNRHHPRLQRFWHNETTGLTWCTECNIIGKLGSINSICAPLITVQAYGFFSFNFPGFCAICCVYHVMKVGQSSKLITAVSTLIYVPFKLFICEMRSAYVSSKNNN